MCRAYGARTMLGNRCPSSGRSGLTFGGRPYGPQSPDRFLENIPRTGLQNCRSLGFARDDKGDGGAFIWFGSRESEPTVAPLRFASVGMTIHILVRDASAQENCHPDNKVANSQDDVFVGVFTKNIPNKLALMGCAPAFSSRVHVRTWGTRPEGRLAVRPKARLRDYQ